jgi:S-adenosylmethionine hydrolase
MTIALLTDFGLTGPYIGQVKAVLSAKAPGVAVIDLFADLPVFDPLSAAYLLPAYCGSPFIPGSLFLCVVDPGVGTNRRPLAVWADGYWFIGPDNGIFALIVRRATLAAAWCIDWRPQKLSNSFHARDLFAPIAAMIATQSTPAAMDNTALPTELPFPCTPLSLAAVDRPAWPDDLWQIVYVDHYGNAITGARGQTDAADLELSVGQKTLRQGSTFATVQPGAGLHYINSNGLIEIAVNSGSASEIFGLRVGDIVDIHKEGSG